MHRIWSKLRELKEFPTFQLILSRITFWCTHRSNEVVGFFPASSERDVRYSETSGVKFVSPQIDESNNRKQLNFNGNVQRQPPWATNQLYQPNPYRQVQATNVNVIRKRPASYLYAHPASSYYNSYPTDLSNPFYKNYANLYQYPPSASSPSYPDYYNPMHYPSPATANQLVHQPSLQYPNYYTNNYANRYEYQRPSSIYGQNDVGGSGENGVTSFLNNIRELNGPLGQISQVGGRFSKALVDISAHDDLQCVPKILCQMVRSSRRPNQVPSFMSAPGLST